MARTDMPVTQGFPVRPRSARDPRDGGPCAPVHPHQAGASTGLNIAPGSDDDGWIVPPPVHLKDGTRIQLYKDGEALHAAYEALKHARRRICLESYIFADDDTGNAFAEMLAAKAQAGVKVYVIYDSFGSFGLSSLVGPKPKIFSMMRRAGVRLAEFHPMRPWEGRYSWRPINRDHRKLLIIDDEIAGLGGLNVGREYAGSWVVAATGENARECDFWRDNAIGLVGPMAKLLLQSFSNTWRYIATGGRIRRAEFHHPMNENDFGVLASVPTRNSQLVPLISKVLHGATRSIDMTMAYFAPPDDLIDLLCRASKRGVKVRLMLPGRCDINLLVTAARSFYETLLAAGIQIYERQHVILHAKTMVIDNNLSILGSTNLDYRSIDYNCELSVVIRNEQFGQQMTDLFDNDVNFARRITNSEWRHRPNWDRFAQWVVNRARYML
ncbi:MAG TPA: phospholipase D-like domain-containing protein [Tepidisphaeraceae bacterium]|jgi:cardiolipin synthase